MHIYIFKGLYEYWMIERNNIIGIFPKHLINESEATFQCMKRSDDYRRIQQTQRLARNE